MLLEQLKIPENNNAKKGAIMDVEMSNIIVCVIAVLFFAAIPLLTQLFDK